MITRARLQTLAIALAGVGVFHILGLPLPFLFGPMFASIFADIAGFRCEGLSSLGRRAHCAGRGGRSLSHTGTSWTSAADGCHAGADPGLCGHDWTGGRAVLPSHLRL